MATYLPPIERPRGLLLKLVYFFARRQFGKVPTPFTEFVARMPYAFMDFYGKLSSLDKKLKLPAQTTVLIRERVASLNTCLFCMDTARWYTARWYATQQSHESASRIDAR